MPCMPVLTTALHPSFTGEWDDEEEVHTSPSAAPASSALGRASQASSRMPSRTASAHQLAPEASDGGDGSASRDSSVGARVRMGGAGGAGGNLSARVMSRQTSMDFTDRRLSVDSSDQSDEYAEAAVSAAAAAAADAEDAFGRGVRGRSASSGFGPPRPSSASGVYPFGCSSSSSSSSRGNGSNGGSGGSGGSGGGASTSRHVRSGSTGSACSNDVGGSSGAGAGGMRSRTKSFSDASSWQLTDDRLLVSSGFVSASMDDRLLEVVAIKGVLQLGLAQVIAFEGLIMKGCLASDGL